MSKSSIKELLLNKLKNSSEEFTVVRLAIELYTTEPTILNHLKILEAAGLVERIKKPRIRAATWKYISNPSVQHNPVNQYE
jgi:predicted transcriptional regulator